MTRAIAFVDLDDTLFQTRRKCPEELAEGQLTPLGFARDGSALSFATPRQMSFLNWLAETTRLIPVTARSLDALRRARISYTAAVCAHGGVVLDEDGAIDTAWAERMSAGAAAHLTMLETLSVAIAASAARLGEPVNVRILTEGETSLYVLAKHEHADADALGAVLDGARPAPADWTVHRNGNNVALLPPYLGKAHAVAYLLPSLRARFPDAAIIGIGDSLTDAPFMTLCDFAMLPARSQLADRLRDAG